MATLYKEKRYNYRTCKHDFNYRWICKWVVETRRVQKPRNKRSPDVIKVEMWVNFSSWSIQTGTEYIWKAISILVLKKVPAMAKPSRNLDIIASLWINCCGTAEFSSIFNSIIMTFHKQSCFATSRSHLWQWIALLSHLVFDRFRGHYLFSTRSFHFAVDILIYSWEQWQQTPNYSKKSTKL